MRMKIRRRKPQSDAKTVVEPESPPVADAMPPDTCVENPLLASDTEDAQTATGTQMACVSTETLEEHNDKHSPLVAEITQWCNSWSVRVSAEAQRSIAELHREIAEAADKAHAEIAKAMEPGKLSEEELFSEDE